MADGAGGSMLGGWSLAFALRWLEEEEDPARGIGPEDAAHQARRPTRPTLAQSPPISSLADAVVLLAEGAVVPPLALPDLSELRYDVELAHRDLGRPP